MPKQPKPKPNPVGRPKLHDQAKSSIVPVRFSAEDRKRVEAAAQASKQTVSEWIRSTLYSALEA
jgi:predicted HicB family RNase H-like nuclease